MIGWRQGIALGRVGLCGMAAIMLMGQSGCQTTQERAEPEAPPAELAWPPPPEEPRIKFVRSISSGDDIGAKKGQLNLTDALLGKKEERGTRMGKPYGVYADAAGKIFVTDSVAARVFVFDVPNKKVTYLGLGGAGSLRQPAGITGDSQGRIYVVDISQRRVVVFDRDGKFAFALKGGDTVGKPTAVALDEARGRIYVTDVANHQLAIFDMQGNLTGTIGKRGKEPGEFNFPTFVSTDSDGTVYVTDQGNFRVQMFNPEGQPVGKFGKIGNRYGNLARPKGLAVDTEGNIYVVDASFNNVQIFDRKGRLLLFFGRGGFQSGQFNLPAGIWIDAKDQIYVVDQVNRRVQIFQFLGSPSA